MSIVAHHDDDLGLINPSIEDDLRQGAAVQTIYITAGDAGQGWGDYPKGREEGIRAAYAHMAEESSPSWTSGEVSVDGMSIAYSELDGADIRLYWLRLPDSYPPRLAELWLEETEALEAVDSGEAYTKDDLISVLSSLIDLHDPAVVRHLNSRDEFGAGDHLDHVAAGRFAAAAVEASETAPTSAIYGSMQLAGLPNTILTPEEQQRKEETVAVYAPYDEIFGKHWDQDEQVGMALERDFSIPSAEPPTLSNPQEASLFNDATLPDPDPEGQETSPATVATAFEVGGDNDWSAVGGRVQLAAGADADVEGGGYFAHLWKSHDQLPGTWLASSTCDDVVRGQWAECRFVQPVALDEDSQYFIAVTFPRGREPNVSDVIPQDGYESETPGLSVPGADSSPQGLMRRGMGAAEGWAPVTPDPGAWRGADVLLEYEPRSAQ
ncbi:PIG-L family deacetylase [Nesterenkonia salmonea]|nr:PIG-L family deacetylase [Nesterenkonia salmonea]